MTTEQIRALACCLAGVEYTGKIPRGRTRGLPPGGVSQALADAVGVKQDTARRWLCGVRPSRLALRVMEHLAAGCSFLDNNC